MNIPAHAPAVTLALTLLSGVFSMTHASSYDAAASEPEAGLKSIQKEIIVDALPGEVWAAWTTLEGIKSFFARGANIKLETFGPYEILFFPDNDPGTRGAEDCIVLAYQQEKMLSFTWSAPPQYPDIRKHRTSVTVVFTPLPNGKTKVNLMHSGWGVGGNWDKTYDYFTKAWDVVLFRLQYRFENGPVDWSNPPRPTL